MQRFINLIPPDLKPTSGSVFNSGSDAFRQPGPGLYLLGLNPGGDPEKHVEQTIEAHLRELPTHPDNWCAHRDQSWDNRPPGTAGMQPRILHVLHRLGLDPGLVPSSNIIFERTRTQIDLGPTSQARSLAQKCWPMHAAVIQALEIRTIVCFGKVAGEFVREQLVAHRLIGSFVETNNRQQPTEAFENEDGIAVIVATHPSRIAWNAPNSDPSEFFRAVMARKPNERIALSSAPVPAPATKPAPARQAAKRSQPDVLPNNERDARLAEIFVASGLDKVLVRKHGWGTDPTFSKLFVVKNEIKILSIELYTKGAGKLRVHHSPDAPYWLKEAFRGLPGAKNPTDSGTDFSGDALAAAKAIAVVLAARRGPIR
jgi:hypothetical protein